MNIPDLIVTGACSEVDLITMQIIFTSVCANLQILPEDAAHRQAIAAAIVSTFQNGLHDVDSMKSAATIAAKSAC